MPRCAQKFVGVSKITRGPVQFVKSPLVYSMTTGSRFVPRRPVELTR